MAPLRFWHRGESVNNVNPRLLHFAPKTITGRAPAELHMNGIANSGADKAEIKTAFRFIAIR